ncbi:MAG: bile acid:sodium symporter family protein [Bacteroidales bacterium]|jgi:BASS family bile acid:Na+ symporter|nr:bile acid:sodium symporter family protein [Bacteroidales bacterium]
MYQELLNLNNITLNFNSGSGVLLMNIAIGLMMFSVALDLRPEHFRSLLANPRIMFAGISSQFILLPLLTFLVVLAFNAWITPAVAFGMLLVAACPGGNISNFITSFSKNNVALGVSLTAVGTVLAMVMTPVNFKIYGMLYDYITPLLCHHATDHAYNQDIYVPLVDVTRTVFIILGIPVGLGFACSNYMPHLTAAIKKPLSYVSGVFFIGFIIVALAGNVEIIKYIKWIFIIVLIHNAVVWIASFCYGKLWKADLRDCRTISIETAIQNSGLGLALLLNPSIFPDGGMGGMVLVVAWWGIWHFIAGGAIGAWWRFVKPLLKSP